MANNRLQLFAAIDALSPKDLAMVWLRTSGLVPDLELSQSLRVLSDQIGGLQRAMRMVIYMQRKLSDHLRDQWKAQGVGGVFARR